MSLLTIAGQVGYAVGSTFATQIKEFLPLSDLYTDLIPFAKSPQGRLSAIPLATGLLWPYRRRDSGPLLYGCGRGVPAVRGGAEGNGRRRQDII